MRPACAVDADALEDFFAFLQCQLRMEAKERLQRDVELLDPRALEIWPHFEAWVRPNLGKREKWMPFHTVLGAHELFAVEEIHHGKVPCWTPKRKFLALFIYRTHCRRELFKVQRAHLEKESFWKDPGRQFSHGGPITRAMLAYRKSGGSMQTQAFRCIPQRLVDDDDENLVFNIARRTQTLLQVAERVWPIVQDDAKSSAAKFDEISEEVLRGKGIGDTWAKMLMVSVDIAFPELKLLNARCEVGVGAVGGLERLLPGTRVEDDRLRALEQVTAAANSSVKQNGSVGYFWELLPKVESWAQNVYKELPLVLEQMKTPAHSLSAVTIQVQLCEWRQFLDYRSKRRACALASETPSLAAPAAAKRSTSGLDSDSEDLPLSSLCSLPDFGEVAAVPTPQGDSERCSLKRRRTTAHGREGYAEASLVADALGRTLQQRRAQLDEAARRLDALRNAHLKAAASLADAERAVADAEASAKVADFEILRTGKMAALAQADVRSWDDHIDSLEFLSVVSDSDVDLFAGGPAIEELRGRVSDQFRQLVAMSPLAAREAAAKRRCSVLEEIRNKAVQARLKSQKDLRDMMEKYEFLQQSSGEALKRVTDFKAARESARGVCEGLRRDVDEYQRLTGELRIDIGLLQAQIEYARSLASHTTDPDSSPSD